MCYYIVFLASSDYDLHCNFRFRVGKEGPVTVTVVVTVNIWAGDLLLVLAAALTVGLMDTGLVTAKLVTGKIGAIVAVTVAI
jgi:hypothetical protein